MSSLVCFSDYLQKLMKSSCGTRRLGKKQQSCSWENMDQQNSDIKRGTLFNSLLNNQFKSVCRITVIGSSCSASFCNKPCNNNLLTQVVSPEYGKKDKVCLTLAVTGFWFGLVFFIFYSHMQCPHVQIKEMWSICYNWKGKYYAEVTSSYFSVRRTCQLHPAKVWWLPMFINGYQV